MAHWAGVPSDKPRDLNLIFGTHMVEGENNPPKVVLCHRMCSVAHKCAPTAIFVVKKINASEWIREIQRERKGKMTAPNEDGGLLLIKGRV